MPWIEFEMPDGTPITIESTEVSDVKPAVDPDATEVRMRNGERRYVGLPVAEVVKKLREGS